MEDTMMIEAAVFSETLVLFYHNIQPHIPEESNLQETAGCHSKQEDCNRAVS
jgi:hypothetical protein